MLCMSLGFDTMSRRSKYTGDIMPDLSLNSPNLIDPRASRSRSTCVNNSEDISLDREQRLKIIKNEYMKNLNLSSFTPHLW